MKKFTNAEVKKILVNAAAKHNNEVLACNKSGRHPSGRYIWDRKPKTYKNIAGRYKPRSGIFTNYSGKFYFDPISLKATSYSWWAMLLVINGKLVRNDCNYSQQTALHQGFLSSALRVLKIKPDLVITTKANLRNPKDVAEAYAKDWAELMVKIKFAQKKTLPFYKADLRRLEKKMTEIQEARIGVRFTKKLKDQSLVEAEASRKDRLKWKREKTLRSEAVKIAVNDSPRQTAADVFPKLTLVK